MKGCLKFILILFLILLIVTIIGYWAYSSLTLEKLGKADEPGILGFVEDSEISQKTARDLGIHDLTLKQLIDYLKGVFNKNKEESKETTDQTTSSIIYQLEYNL